MKRVLIITYFFPPQPSAGAVRTGYIAKYLPEFGWQPTVLTLDYPGESGINCAVIKTQDWIQWSKAATETNAVLPPSRKFHNAPFLNSFVRNVIYFPDRTVGWILGTLYRSLELTANQRFDAVLSSAPPATVHVVAGITARKRGLPWVADYRDPWAANTYANRGPLRTALEYALEQRLIKPAAAITTISESIANSLRAVHNRSTVEVIPHTYDPADWENIPLLTPDVFRLSYTGGLYHGQRSPDALFSAIRKLQLEGDPAGMAARFDFYGHDSDFVPQMAAKYGLDRCVTYHGIVDRVEAMRIQRRSAALLLLLKMDPATSHELGSKIFEYIGARRPIVAIGPPDSAVKKLIVEKNLGWFASDEREIIAALREAYGRFLNQVFELPAQPALYYTARDLVRKFASILDQIV